MIQIYPSVVQASLSSLHLNRGQQVMMTDRGNQESICVIFPQNCTLQRCSFSTLGTSLWLANSLESLITHNHFFFSSASSISNASQLLQTSSGGNYRRKKEKTYIHSPSHYLSLPVPMGNALIPQNLNVKMACDVSLNLNNVC